MTIIATANKRTKFIISLREVANEIFKISRSGGRNQKEVHYLQEKKHAMKKDP